MASTTTRTPKKGPEKKGTFSPDDLTKGRKGKTAELSEEELKNVSGGEQTHHNWMEL
jgi:bacteriocin-like protein